MAVAAAVPLEDTEEVKAAKAEFAAKFAAAEAGELADLQAAQIPTAYLADLEDVTKAKEEFMAVFNAYKAGEIPLPVAPVHEVAPVSVSTFFQIKVYSTIFLFQSCFNTLHPFH